MKKLLIAALIGALLLSGCSSKEESAPTEAIEQAEDGNADIEAMRAEIESLKSQLDEQDSAEDNVSENVGNDQETVGESSGTAENDEVYDADDKTESVEDICERYKVYIADHSLDFANAKFALIQLTDDDTPDLLYTTSRGFQGVLTFDGKKTKPIESVLPSPFLECIVSYPDNTELVLYYSEKGNRFAVYKHEYKPESTNKSAADDELNVFYEINERGQINESAKVDKDQIIDAGEVAVTLFHVDNIVNATREDYDEAVESYYTGLDKSIDLFNDSYASVDDALAAYKSGK